LFYNGDLQAGRNGRFQTIPQPRADVVRNRQVEHARIARFLQEFRAKFARFHRFCEFLNTALQPSGGAASNTDRAQNMAVGNMRKEEIGLNRPFRIHSRQPHDDPIAAIARTAIM
jgi:hypothetical protein